MVGATLSAHRHDQHARAPALTGGGKVTEGREGPSSRRTRGPFRREALQAGHGVTQRRSGVVVLTDTRHFQVGHFVWPPGALAALVARPFSTRLRPGRYLLSAATPKSGVGSETSPAYAGGAPTGVFHGRQSGEIPPAETVALVLRVASLGTRPGLVGVE